MKVFALVVAVLAITGCTTTREYRSETYVTEPMVEPSVIAY